MVSSVLAKGLRKWLNRNDDEDDKVDGDDIIMKMMMIWLWKWNDKGDENDKEK